MIRWLDAHTHLDADDLYPQKDEVLKRAEASGVQKLLTVNSEATTESFARTSNCLETQWSGEIFGAFGVHPHQASLFNERLERELRVLLKQPRVIAFGEIGLDFYYNYSPQNIQIEAFKRQVRLAAELQLPVVIHCRDAYGLLAQILQAENQQHSGMIHCFTGTPQEAERLLDLGFHISFSGIVTFRNADQIRNAAIMVPEDRILVETDAPFLAPVPHRGKINEPARVEFTAKLIAELKGISEETFSERLFSNFQTLFTV